MLGIEQRRGTTTVTVELHDHPHGVEVRGRVYNDHPAGTYWHRDDTVDLILTLTRPVACRLAGVGASWDLQPAATEDSPFLAVADRIHEAATTAVSDEDDGHDPRPELVHLCEQGAVTAVQRCDVAARHLALAFASDARMFVYAALLEDWWRRVEQALGACPGVFVLGAALPSCRPAVLASIRAGTKLGRIVSFLAATAPSTNRHATTLVRRAPRELSAAALIALLREPAIDPNDAPVTERELAIWYAWCAAAARAARPLAAFVSKHAVELELHAHRRGLDARLQLAEIVDWLAATRASLPSRSSAPARVLAAIDAWHLSLWSADDRDPATPLPPAPTAMACVDGIHAEPLRTIGELFGEGRRMHHCVGSRADAAFMSHHAFFRGVVHGEPVTIEVARGPSGWYLVEASGFANRRPPSPGVIERWVQTLRDPRRIA